MSSSHLLFGLPNGLVNIGFHLYTLLTILSSAIRCKWPNQLNLCACKQFVMSSCLLNVNTLHGFLVPPLFTLLFYPTRFTLKDLHARHNAATQRKEHQVLKRKYYNRDKWVLSPWHGMSSGCRWRNGIQIRRVAANILNNQSWTADKGWCSSLEVGRGADNSSP